MSRLFGTITFNPPNTVVFNHNTGISLSGSGYLSLGSNNPKAAYYGFTFENSIGYQLTYGILGCQGLSGTSLVGLCAVSPVITNNLIVGNVTNGLPAGNFNVASSSAVGYANFNGGNGGDYTLCISPGLPSASCTAASPYAASGTDGLPLGADIGAVNQATAGVN
jgi:hypothetical protein